MPSEIDKSLISNWNRFDRLPRPTRSKFKWYCCKFNLVRNVFVDVNCILVGWRGFIGNNSFIFVVNRASKASANCFPETFCLWRGRLILKSTSPSSLIEVP